MSEVVAPKGIKEVMELIAAFKELGLVAKKVMADGKISISDLGLLPELLAKHQTILDGVMGANLVVDEVKDLSADESMQIVAALYSAFAEVKNA